MQGLIPEIYKFLLSWKKSGIKPAIFWDSRNFLQLQGFSLSFQIITHVRNDIIIISFF